MAHTSPTAAAIAGRPHIGEQADLPNEQARGPAHSLSSFLWEVYGHCPRETIAVFFNYGEAVSYVNANSHSPHGEQTGFERRNLYIREKRAPDALELTARHVGDNRWQVAA